MNSCKVAVVIPCFKVEKKVLQVLSKIGSEVDHIFVIDDKCPNNSGKVVETKCIDPRVKVIYHDKNKGVGGAVVSGYQAALESHCQVVIKIDGDGQMDPKEIPKFLEPLVSGRTDYAKGNRFYDMDLIKPMPLVRLFGNAVLTFLNKLMSGYWTMFDPTNGYTAIHESALRRIPLHKLSERYFFESDMLFRLGVARAVICDIPIPAKYEDEQSSLRISKVLFEFPPKIFARISKRILYKYFVRDFNLGTFYLLGFGFFTFTGGLYGIYHMVINILNHTTAPSGVVMFAALPIILGFQLLLSFFSYDLFSEPRESLQQIHRESRKISAIQSNSSKVSSF